MFFLGPWILWKQSYGVAVEFFVSSEWDEHMTQQLHRRDESSKYTHAALWVCDQTSESSIFMVMAGQRCAGGKHKERQPFDVLSINRNVQQEHF